MSSIKQAFADADRSYIACKASVSQATSVVMSRGPGGAMLHRPDYSRSAEAMKHLSGWVFACVRPIASRIAAQPIHVGHVKSKRKLSTKNHQPVDVDELDSHPLLDLLADPNPLGTGYSLIWSLIAGLELTGKGLLWVPSGKAIFNIPASWIRDWKGSDSYESFEIQPPNLAETISIPAEEAIYCLYPHPGDPFAACSPLSAAAASVDADEAMSVSQVVAFKRGLHPSHSIHIGKDHEGRRPRLSSGQQQQLISALQKRYADVANAGSPFIVDGMVEKIERISNTIQEMDYLDSGKSMKSKISQIFGVNPIIMGEIEGANRASAFIAEVHFCSLLNSKIQLLSETFTTWCRWIFNDPSLVVWFEPCVPHDSEMAIRWADTLIKSGSVRKRELRELAPFNLDLDDEEFEAVVNATGHDPNAEAMTQAIEEANETMKKSFNFELGFPMDRLVDNIFERSKATK